jgi:uncharacterized surface protein with fasciclin (FAS1) repeats
MANGLIVSESLNLHGPMSCRSVVVVVVALLASCESIAKQTSLLELLQTNTELQNMSSLCKLSAKCSTTTNSSSLTTMFAPLDSAFAELPASTLQKLWAPSNQQQRDSFILTHLVFGDILSTVLKPSQDLETLAGTAVHVSRSAKNVIHVDNATIVKADLVCANGVAHTINQCINPGHGPAPSPGPGPSVPTPPAPAPKPPTTQGTTITTRTATVCSSHSYSTSTCMRNVAEGQVACTKYPKPECPPTWAVLHSWSYEEGGGVGYGGEWAQSPSTIGQLTCITNAVCQSPA